MCIFPLGYRRASGDEKNEDAENQKDKSASMTEEQREYLRWYYRTEDRKLLHVDIGKDVSICHLK